MSDPVPDGLSVSVETVKAYITNALVPVGVTTVWVVGSRSKRRNKVPRLDSDWDLEVMGNIDWSRPLPLPSDYGLYGEAHKTKHKKDGAVMLYPNWELEDEL